MAAVAVVTKKTDITVALFFAGEKSVSDEQKLPISMHEFITPHGPTQRPPLRFYSDMAATAVLWHVINHAATAVKWQW